MMKISKKQIWNIFFCLVAQGYLLVMTSAAGGLAMRAALCGVSFCAFVYVYLKKPLKGLPIKRSFIKLIHTFCAIELTLTMVRAGEYVSTMGVFAVVPTNLFALAVYLLGPLAFRPKEKPDPPEMSET